MKKGDSMGLSLLENVKLFPSKYSSKNECESCVTLLLLRVESAADPPCFLQFVFLLEVENFALVLGSTVV